MVLKPDLGDLKIIAYYLGRIIIGIGLTMFMPFFIGIIFKEYNPAADFVISALACVIFGQLLTSLGWTKKDLNWMHGMIAVALAWLGAMIFGAIPLYLSGHWKSYLDACFESMSGFATTGLTLVQDLDHLSRAHNFWRHFGPFIGGQGIAVVALSFFVKGSSGAFKMYVGEAREERILPNVIHTSRIIWFISLAYLLLGTLALGISGIFIGLKPSSAFYHGACIFMAAFDTAGFAPQSQNILYYHSFLFEIVTMAIMLCGAINFNLHYQLLIGNYKEIKRNIETRLFFFSVCGLFFVLAAALGSTGIYRDLDPLFRKGFFQLISGHTTTGYMTIYARQFINEWGAFALVVLTIVMAIGGCACSTAGGIKVLRVGIIFKALYNDIKRIMLPESTVIVEKYHHIKDIIFEDRQVRAAALILLCYLGLYAFGAIVAMLLGYPALSSLFESTSAAANVGFSCGITQSSMPAVLKITYIFQMWIGRLEFMSVFTLVGFFVAAVRGR